MTRNIKQLIGLLLIVSLFAIAFSLRIGAINHTEINAPVRADAADYYHYALNLRTFGTYSRSRQWKGLDGPPPDSFRSPGYPIFIMPWVEYPPTKNMLWRISFFQAILDSLSVLLIFLILRSIIPVGFAFLGAALAALSPHLISMTTYMLTETLYAFLVLLSICLALLTIKYKKASLSFLCGASIAIASLTRPTFQYFIPLIIFLLVIHLNHPERKRIVLAAVLGFVLLFSPWVLRNASVPSSGGLALATVHHGMYPDFMYEGDIRSKGFPYRHDPNAAEITKSWEALTDEIIERFRQEPSKHLKWYMVQKPIELFSWDMIQGMGDVFIYPVSESPYFQNEKFILTHKVMRAIHWPILAAAFVCMIFSLLRPRFLALSESGLFTCRLMGIVIFYHVAIHMVGAPFPRYGIPLRPEIYGLAAISLYGFFTATSKLIKNNAEPRVL